MVPKRLPWDEGDAWESPKLRVGIYKAFNWPRTAMAWPWQMMYSLLHGVKLYNRISANNRNGLFLKLNFLSSDLEQQLYTTLGYLSIWVWVICSVCQELCSDFSRNLLHLLRSGPFDLLILASMPANSIGCNMMPVIASGQHRSSSDVWLLIQYLRSHRSLRMLVPPG